MMEEERIGFGAIPCLLKRIIKHIFEFWMGLVQLYLGKYEALCSFVQFWSHFVWLMMRTRGFLLTCYDRHGSFRKGAIFIEELLRKMYDDGSYDPYEFPNFGRGFDRKIAFINISGEAAVYAMYMTGLKTLRLVKHASLREENDQLKLKSELEAGELNLYSAGRIKFMKLGPEIRFRLKIRYLQAHVEFSVDSETGRNGKLDKFVIYDMRGIDTRLAGFSFFDPVVNTILYFLMKIFKRFFRNLIEEVAEACIQKNLRDFQFPLLSDLEVMAVANEEAAPESETTRNPTVQRSSEEPRADVVGRSRVTDRTDAMEDIPGVKVSSEMSNPADLESIIEEGLYEPLDSTASEMSSSASSVTLDELE